LSEQSEKFIAIAIGLALLGAIVAWRTLSPQQGGAGQGGPAGLQSKVLAEKDAPEGYKAQTAYFFNTVDGLQSVELGKLELFDAKAELERMRTRKEDSPPVRNLELKLGANATVLAPPEEAPDGGASMLATLYLVHSGPFPSENVAQRHQAACVLVEVDPAGPAGAAGLRVGDVWAGVDDLDTLATHPVDPCKEIGGKVKAAAAGSTLKFIVMRGRARSEIEVKKAEGGLKFVAIPVPVLDSDRLGSAQ
jgi:hypothetical protein